MTGPQKIKIKENKSDKNKEDTVFDAVRDNKGKGIHIDKLIKTLEQIQG